MRPSYGNPAAALLVVVLLGCKPEAADPNKLHVYCGAGIRPPVEELAAAFGEEQGVRVEVDYAGSNVLLSRIKLSQKGDVYIPGDTEYVKRAEAEGLVESAVDACYFVPVLLVPKGNPKGILDVADLARKGARIGLGDAEACAIGGASEEILAKAGLAREQWEPNVVFRSLTVNELGVQIQAGKIDACIVWDAVARSFEEDGEAVEIPVEENTISTVPVAVLNTSERPELARRFQEHATSERGRAVFREHGYTTELPEG